MDPEAFVRWAMDDARTVEERYCVELLKERWMGRWRSLRGLPFQNDFEAMVERKRQRHLNPAYQPTYSEEDVRRLTEVVPEITAFDSPSSYDDRPLRDFKALRFLPRLHTAKLGGEFPDLSPLLELAALRTLHLHAQGCEDHTPLARCQQLRELHLTLGSTWPEVKGLENLSELETLTLHGNLLVFERGVTFPKVTRGALKCSPLAARCVRDLPQLPACRLLTLSGVERLDGIEAFAELRNLDLECEVRDFAPVARLPELTSFTCSTPRPLDVTPLIRAPKLLYAAFTHHYKWDFVTNVPRDYAPLVESNSLRQVEVPGCPPVKMEVATLNAVLPPWNDLFERAEPRALPPLRIISAPMNHHPRREEANLLPGETLPLDERLRKCELRWVAKQVERAVTKKLGMSEWGSAEAPDYSVHQRKINLQVESFAAVERLSEIVETARTTLARMKGDYYATFLVGLKVPPAKLTKAQQQLLDQFQKEQEEFESEKRQREREEYLERLHRYQLKKQEPPPDAPWEREEEKDDDDEDGDGDTAIAIKEDPEPPPFWKENDHPLADQYRMYGVLTLEGLWVQADPALIKFTFGRAPDEVIEEKKKDG
jgi:hypothetical protein